MKKLIITAMLCIALQNVKGQDSLSLTNFINKWVGKPYRYGGTTEKGIDCSAFVQRLYKDVYNSIIPRTCSRQYKFINLVLDSVLEIGDLLFFNSKVSPSGWHVGVYLGNGEFIHAANFREGVKISCLDDYSRIFKGAGRLNNHNGN
jgi:lipoprotein Spr